MDTTEILKAFKGDSWFLGVYSRDQMLTTTSRPVALIANTDAARDPGTHWIAIILEVNGRGLYFDSFGLPPLFKEFIEYLDCHCWNGWTYNHLTFQSHTATTCGNYCILFLHHYFKGCKFNNFSQLFPSGTETNELLLKMYFSSIN